jgi:hypothetical protein
MDSRIFKYRWRRYGGKKDLSCAPRDSILPNGAVIRAVINNAMHKIGGKISGMLHAIRFNGSLSWRHYPMAGRRKLYAEM